MPSHIVQIAFLMVMHLTAMAQLETPVNASYKNTTLADILSAWSNEYSLDFAFDSYELSKYKATVDFKNRPLSEGLSELLKDTPFAFQQLDATVVIYPIAKASPLTSSVRTSAQTLSGSVVDAFSGEVLPFAVVALVGGAGSTTCDEFGNFSLNLPAIAERDTLLAAYVGYSAAQWPLEDVLSNQPIRLALVPQATMLGDVQVEERRNRFETALPGLNGILLKPDDVQARYGLGEADLFRIAQQQPGVAGSLETSNGLVIRGGAADQSLLLMDGFTIYHQDHFFGMFSAVNAYAVKSMRLQKSITDIELGGRAAGALELWGKEGDLREASGRIECGTLSLSGAVEAPLDSSGKASVFICGRRSLTEAFRSPAYRELFNTLYSGAVAYGSDAKLDAFNLNFKPAVQFQDINAKITYHPGTKTRINLSLYASRDDMDFAYADTADSQLLDVTDVRYSDETNKTNRGIAFRWQQRYSNQLQSNTVVGGSWFAGSYFSTDSITNNLFLLDTNQFNAREMGLRDFSVRHHWQWNQNSHEWRGGLAWNSIRTSDSRRSSSLGNQNEVQTANVYTLLAGDTWRPQWRWSIYYGGRLNFFSERKRLYAEPRLAIHWQAIPKRLTLRFNATRCAQFIQRTSSQNLYQNAPDVWQPALNDIPVLLSEQLAIGILWSARQWSVDIEGYRKWNKGQVTNAQLFALNGGSGGDIVPMVGDADIVGLDAQFQWKWKHHVISLGYSYMDALSYYANLSPAGIRESYYRRHEAKAGCSLKRNGWSISMLQLVTDGSPYTALAGFYTLPLPGDVDRLLPVPGAPNGDQSSWYLRTDVVAGYEWNWGAHRLTLQGSVYNVFNRINTRSVQYSVLPAADNSADYDVSARPIQMIGRIPSIHLSWQF